MAFNYYSQSGTLDIESYRNHVVRTIDEVVNLRDESPMQGMQFVRKVSNQLADYVEADQGVALNLPVKNEDTDDLPAVQPPPGRSQTITTYNYRSLIQVERSLVEMQRFGKVNSMIAGLPKSVDRKYEYAIADLFNNGFATHTGADGAYLWANSHDEISAYGSSWDNLESGALSLASFSSARVNMRKRTNVLGHVMPRLLTKLIVPPDLERKAKELRASELKPEGSTNDKNVWQNEFAVFVYDWLTSTTAWFTWDETDAGSDQNGFILAERAAPSTAAVNYPNPDIILGRRIRFAMGVGARDARMTHGSTGS